MRQRLRELVESLCLLEGDFVLSTGAKSQFYFDCKRATLNGEALALIADEFLHEINRLPEKPQAIGGLTMGADFITAAVVMRAAQTDHPTNLGSIVRKARKEHGTRSFIENELEEGTSVVVVDDVVTTGTSTARAARAMREAGCRIVGIVCLIDREAGGMEALRGEFNVDVRSVFRKSDFPTPMQSNELGQSDERLAASA
ncbi:MAG: orotate phosphoribosyltransferase [Gammaproteobacteria bacterium]|nr:orotate phosphoribosyltransferase [Gammaproteobacteria bacterium]